MCHVVFPVEEKDACLVRKTDNPNNLIFLTKQFFPTQKIQHFLVGELPEDVDPLITQVAQINGVGEIGISHTELSVTKHPNVSWKNIKNDIKDIIENYNPD